MDNYYGNPQKAGRSPESNIAAVTESSVITAQSDDVCPSSGIWEIVDLVSTCAVLRSGDSMPRYYGREVLWVLVRRG